MKTVHGNTSGLKAHHRKELERLYERRLDPATVVTPLVATRLVALAVDMERQVGIVADRSGRITHVVVGEATKLELPDLGRERTGQRRLRGLRLVHVHQGGALLDLEDLLELTRLRLDMVVALLPDRAGTNPNVHLAYPVYAPGMPDPYERIGPVPLSALELDFERLVSALEEELRRASREIPSGKDGRAILVRVSKPGQRDGESSLEELGRLAESAGVTVARSFHQKRPKFETNTIVGKGKLLEIVTCSLKDDAEVLIFDHDLSPRQARTIEQFTNMRVLDRSQLILDIFAQRAHSSEGKLQVELAQLRYMMPRLSERDDALSRLTGGIGARGPGETKLEIGKRRVKEHVGRLEERIEQLALQRRQRRKRRQRAGVPLVALVGYTNAGKSTLMNFLTGAQVPAGDRLFETLDPTTRQLVLPSGRSVVLSDTVGFIRRLPEPLARAFRATLEEIDDASAVVHLVDASDAEAEMQIAAVEGILGELELASVPRVIGVNKADRAAPDTVERLVRLTGGLPLSARSGEGMQAVLARLDEILAP